MAFWAYLLRCGDGSFYAGHTDALDPRTGAYQAGRGCAYTARRLPVALVWAQDFPSRIEGLEAERRIKGWSRAKKEALIAGDWDRVSELARSRVARPSTSSGRTEGGGESDAFSPICANPFGTAQDGPVEAPAPIFSVRPELVEGQAANSTPDQ